ncbi:MAG: hypothetical protein ACI867_000862 [Glaciecola sp.]|jgi:hypothetical protein
MARAALGVGAVLSIPVVGIAFVVRDLSGALTALGALVIVIGQFVLTARSLAWAAKKGPVAVQATALGGFGLRLMFYAILILSLRGVEAIDGQVLAIVTALSLIVLLSYEVRLVMGHAEMWFIDADARPAAKTPKVVDPALFASIAPGKASS